MDTTKYDPYCDEDLLRLLDETSDIESEDDLDADKTYHPSKGDISSDSDSDILMKFVQKPSEDEEVVDSVPSKPTSDENGEDYVCQPSTSKEQPGNVRGCRPTPNASYKPAGIVKEKKLTKKIESKQTNPCKNARKGQMKRNPSKSKVIPKRQWKKSKFTSKNFPGPLNLDDLENPESLRLPSEYFTEYLSEDFYTQAALFTNMYSVKTTGRSANTNARGLKTFVALNLVMGCFPFPRLRLYWQRGFSFPCVTEFMSRDRFLMLRNIFHLVDTENPPPGSTDNRLWKVQPIIDAVKKVCLSLPRDHLTYSVDEQMIPFTGRCPLKQFVKNKPRPVGLKVFVITSSSGLVLDFEVYQGHTTPLLNIELGQGPAVVMTMAKTIPQGSFLFFDRYFTTVSLLEKLESLGIEGTGTILANRLSGIEVNSEEDLTLKRGQCSEYVSEDKKLVLVEWQDTKKVLMASTCFGASPTTDVKRWSKKENKFIDVPCPPIVRNYNQCMGGVDMFNQLMEYYRTFFKTRKWTWKVILHFIDFAVVNSHLLYLRDAKANKIPRKNRHDLLSFRLALYEWLLHSNKRKENDASSPEESEEEPPIKRSKFFNPPVKMPVADKRYDGFEHWPVVDDITAPRACRLEGCSSRSKVMCEKCKTYLCLSKQKNCFKEFYSKK